MSVCPAKTQIGQGNRPGWSESSLSAWRNLGSLATHYVHSEDSDQTGQMPRLIWFFDGRTVTLLVLSCRGSYFKRLLGRTSLFAYTQCKELDKASDRATSWHSACALEDLQTKWYGYLSSRDMAPRAWLIYMYGLKWMNYVAFILKVSKTKIMSTTTVLCCHYRSCTAL